MVTVDAFLAEAGCGQGEGRLTDNGVLAAIAVCVTPDTINLTTGG